MKNNDSIKPKKILIVGAGISGLSAGIHALLSGYDATILEKNPVSGGLCTGWYRKGRYIDGCIHWLTGTKEGTILNDTWKLLGAFDSQDDIINLPSWGSFNYDGTTITFWADTKKAEQEWLNVSPIDKRQIKKFFRLVNSFSKVELPLDKPISWHTPYQLFMLIMRMIKIGPSYLTSMLISREKYAKRFKNPAIRFALNNIQPGSSNLYSMLYGYSNIVTGNGGIIKGGSMQFTKNMENKFVNLGGQIKFNKCVDEILIEDGKAIGVKLTNGEIIKSDYIISCVDGYHALNKLLKNQYPIKLLEKRQKYPEYYDSPTCVYISLLVDDELKDMNVPTTINCEPFNVGLRTFSYLTMRPYTYQKNLYTKDGKTLMTIILEQSGKDYDYWKWLNTNKEKYNKQKEEIANKVIEIIYDKYPNLKDKITLLDVATPITYERYVNAYRGSYMGYLIRPGGHMFVHNGNVGLKNFYLSGQWVQDPGGLPIAATNGKFAVLRILRKDKGLSIYNLKLNNYIGKMS